jgi:phytoene dehydrogenase-like protein
MSNIISNSYNPSSQIDSRKDREEDIVVIGAGLAGLTTAVMLARAGRSVTVFEQSSKAGGRARTENIDGYYFNQGPHALYLGGVGAKILRELGIEYSGNPPPLPQYLVKGGKKYQQAASLSSILTTKLLKGISSRTELLRFFTSLKKINFAEIQHVSLQHWLHEKIHHRDVLDLIQTLSRVVTYANDPDIQSAGTTLQQIQIALSGGVVYLDRGWQTLVDGLVAAAQKAKVRIITGKRVLEVKHNLNSSTITSLTSSPSWRIYTSDSSALLGSTLIVTGNPRDVYELFRHDGQQYFVSNIIDPVTKPVRIATLDIALSKLPNPEVPVAIGVDAPLYLSVHSSSANLAPKGGALIHVMKYMSSSYEPNPKQDRLEMEALLDMIQPGWRDVIIRQRFLPNMTVYNSLVTAAEGGITGRPDTKVSGVESLYIAGDWVGSEGLLADASFASAKRAAEQILETQPRLISSLA